MQNFVPLRDVFQKVTDLLAATASHLDAVAVRTPRQDDGGRGVLLAKTIATQRQELVSAMREYCRLAPEYVMSTWVQYTAETDLRRLIAELRASWTVSNAIGSLDRLDQALREVFEILERQQHPNGAQEACGWAARQLETELERRASTVLTATDV
jgi:phenylpropionate dioxygenase-like ring-hydroxylating dioxygenase large terminal subunit